MPSVLLTALFLCLFVGPGGASAANLVFVTGYEVKATGADCPTCFNDTLCWPTRTWFFIEDVCYAWRYSTAQSVMYTYDNITTVTQYFRDAACTDRFYSGGTDAQGCKGNALIRRFAGACTRSAVPTDSFPSPLVVLDEFHQDTLCTGTTGAHLQYTTPTGRCVASKDRSVMGACSVDGELVKARVYYGSNCTSELYDLATYVTETCLPQDGHHRRYSCSAGYHCKSSFPGLMSGGMKSIPSGAAIMTLLAYLLLVA